MQRPVSPSGSVVSDSMDGAVKIAAGASQDPGLSASESARAGAGAGADDGSLASSADSTGRPKVTKRTDYLSWDEYFMSLAFLSAMRSKDPSTQVGACIVDAHHRVVSIGYNGFVGGVSDDDLPWAREADNPLDTKYPYVVHAEVNAVLNRNAGSVRGCTMYVALFPCNECTKILIQSGISEVVYLSDKYHDTVPMIASRRMLDLAGVKTRQYIPKDKQLVINFGT